MKFVAFCHFFSPNKQPYNRTRRDLPAQKAGLIKSLTAYKNIPPQPWMWNSMPFCAKRRRKTSNTLPACSIKFHVKFAQWHLHTSSPLFNCHKALSSIDASQSTTQRLIQTETRRITFDNDIIVYIRYESSRNSIKIYIFSRLPGVLRVVLSLSCWMNKMWRKKNDASLRVFMFLLWNIIRSESVGNVKQETHSWEIAQKDEKPL